MIIPGSRGAHSYLVMPIGNNDDDAADARDENENDDDDDDAAGDAKNDGDDDGEKDTTRKRSVTFTGVGDADDADAVAAAAASVDELELRREGRLRDSIEVKGNHEAAGFSLAHGAGRKWKRSKCRSILADKYPKAAVMITTQLGSKVICEDKDLLYEEDAEAYKNVSSVVKDLERWDLVKVVAILRPVISYKCRA